jgi:TetR/AcrR family transcriptional repressor of mexJK operon
LARRFIELVFDPEVVAMFRVVVGEAGAHPKTARLFYATGPATTIDAVTQFLAGQADAGRLEVDDATYAATQFLSMLKGEFHLRLMLNLCEKIDAATLERHLNTTVDQSLTLYGKGPDGGAGGTRA